MLNNILKITLVTGLITIAVPVYADTISVGDKDTIESILAAQSGKRVAVKIKSGQELAGTVMSVTKELTHLGELAGKEYYDAIVVNKAIEAVIFRVK